MDIEEVIRRARNGPRALFLRRVFAILVSLITVVTVPHFVGPRAYGLAAMSSVLFGLAEMLKDFGLTSAMMRRGNIEPEEVNFLFWFNLLMTLTLAVLIALLSPVIASYFHEAVVRSIIYVTLVGFIIGGLALQHRAIVSRELRFSTLAIVDSTALLVQFLVTLALAIAFHDVWSIVWGGVAASVVSSLLIMRASGWRPGHPALIKETRSILVFGANASIYSISVFLSTNLLPVLVGHLAGSASLGQLNRASAFLGLPQKNLVDPIAQAALPVLARLRPSPDSYRKAYLELVRNLHLIVVPSAVVLFVSSPSLMVSLLGTKWTLAGYLLRALSPCVAALGLGYAAGDLFITQDRASEMRTLGIVELVVRSLAVFAGFRWGVISAAYAYSFATLCVVLLRIFVAGMRGPITFSDHLAAVGPSIPVGLGALIGASLGPTLSAAFHFVPVTEAALTMLFAGAVALLAGVSNSLSRSALLELASAVRIPNVVKGLHSRRVRRDHSANPIEAPLDLKG